MGLSVNTFGLRWVMGSDQAALSAWFLEQLEERPPALWSFGHGRPLTHDLDRVRALFALSPEGSGTTSPPAR